MFEQEKPPEDKIYIQLDTLFNQQTDKDEYIISFESMRKGMDEAVERGINYPYIFVGTNREVARKLLGRARDLRKTGKEELEIYREIEDEYRTLSTNP